ncbi:MAG: hypothetical protein HY695_04030 [Deltaproteobacteria bacterium]|nr:hypothetical protein [Deltaproteobacteria bacterium]
MSYLETQQWYVVYSKPRREESAELYLRLKGLEVFFPRLCLPESVSKQGRIVPLFSNYLFVRMNISKDYYCVLWSPGVKRIVSFNGNPSPLDEQVVLFLRERANSDGIIMARASLKVRQQIKISGGPLDGLVGIIQEPLNGKERIKVLLQLLNRQVTVELPLQFVKSEWTV